MQYEQVPIEEPLLVHVPTQLQRVHELLVGCRSFRLLRVQAGKGAAAQRPATVAAAQYFLDGIKLAELGTSVFLNVFNSKKFFFAFSYKLIIYFCTSPI